MANSVVQLTEIEPEIIQIKMQDTAHKNTFTEELIQGLIEAFKEINNHDKYKVVILTGYDSYFSCGGTQESLQYLSEGKGSFTDINIYSLALDCPIPVISSMQGHGIGGGFVMGLFADFVILSKESIYTTNFMKYGFTPGMGATYILPKKLGLSLSEEMMLSAKNYYGGDLQNRGIPFPVLSRAKIGEYTLEMARTVAEKPRVSLITLKDHLVADLRKDLTGIIEKEVVMHGKTFHQPEVRERIDKLFGK